jgi:Ni2+-binding GTPase involved in maturation of urease and hydrogenase
MDLAEAAEFNEEAASNSIQAVRPRMRVLNVSAETGQGMDEFLSFLETRRSRSRAAAAV